MPKGVYVRGENSKAYRCRINPIEAFWLRVNKDGPIHPVLLTKCWVWTGAVFSDGYGQWRTKRSHRFSYSILVGEIPHGMQVLHHCDNPVCVNPDHLFLGTPQDNMDDKVRKGRQGPCGPKTPPDGELNGRAKLTAEQVLEARRLRKDGLSVEEILTVIGSPVAAATLRSALAGRTWRLL